jgi:hypothetical protein
LEGEITMKSSIKIEGDSNIDFSPPQIRITIAKIVNKDSDSPSGTVRFLLLNGCINEEGDFYNTKLIAKFYIKPVWANSTRPNLSRVIEMKQDITEPYLILKVQEKKDTEHKWRYADSVKFKKLSEQVMRPKSMDKSTDKGPDKGINFEDVKNGLKLGLKVVGAGMTIASTFMPVLSVPSMMVNAISVALENNT